MRGFHRKSAAAQELLETIGETFLAGFAYAAQARTPEEAEPRLEDVTVSLRGFAYEGAAMGFAVRDAIPLPGEKHIPRFLAGRGDAHVYMAYVGIGWAMARVPRTRWRAIAPADPLLRWLALDGYGFHQAYFQTRRYVHDQVVDHRLPWHIDGSRWYAGRAVDQGIGRALWFVGGTDVGVVTELIARFPERRRADLYSGAGLAATYAGGVGEAELLWFWDHAGAYRPQVAQGSAFAAAARVRSGLVMPHNDLATGVFCGMPARRAAEISDRVQPAGPPGGPAPADQVVPAYEEWRRRVANEFVSIGRC